MAYEAHSLTEISELVGRAKTVLAALQSAQKVAALKAGEKWECQLKMFLTDLPSLEKQAVTLRGKAELELKAMKAAAAKSLNDEVEAAVLKEKKKRGP